MRGGGDYEYLHLFAFMENDFNPLNQLSHDESFVMLSALQHYLFCKRQCALIHLEQIWTENHLTALGRVLHEHVDERKSETRRMIRQATAIRLVSHRLGIFGVADMVEFYMMETEYDSSGEKVASSLPGLAGFWHPFPVEYKRGRPKVNKEDEVQLCAQAICLEEMLEVKIPSGALFYGETKHRMDVVFDSSLRTLTEETAKGVHSLLDSGVTPKPTFGKWCASCSLVDECNPKLVSSHISAKNWLDNEMSMC